MEAESVEGFEVGGRDLVTRNVLVLWKPGEERKQISPRASRSYKIIVLGLSEV